MTRPLKLAEGLGLPIEAVTEKLAWIGRTGSGKSYGAMKLAELMLEAGAQIGALDPVGVWRSLRVPAAPDGHAFPVVVFGGLYGDLPLQPSAGELIADVVCDRGLSFVLDVSQFIPSEQQRFARGFCDRFFQRKKAAPSAVHLFLEECQEFIPQNPMGDEAATLHAFQRLWKLGRNFGIGGSLISQRPQEISKKAFNMSGTLFAFQMTGPQERKTVREWVSDHGIATDIEGVLQKLKVGEPHVESPTFLGVSKSVHILPRVTADLSSTPKVGASTVARRPLTPIDVEQLTRALADTIEKAKADDPRELRKELARVRRELSDAERVRAEGPQASAILPQPALSDADRDLIRVLADELRDSNRRFCSGDADSMAVMQQKAESAVVAALSALRSELAELMVARHDQFARRLETAGFRQVIETLERISVPAIASRQPAGARAVSPGRYSAATRPAEPRAPRVHDGSGLAGDRLPAGEHAVLTAALQYPGLDRKRLGVLTGYKRSSRDAYIARLASKGLLEVNGALLYPTDAGTATLGDAFAPLPTGHALANYWRERLPEGERKTLDVLLEAEGDLDRAAIEAATGYKRSSRDAYLSRLKARGLVEFTGRGLVRANEELFG